MKAGTAPGFQRLWQLPRKRPSVSNAAFVPDDDCAVGAKIAEIDPRRPAGRAVNQQARAFRRVVADVSAHQMSPST